MSSTTGLTDLSTASFSAAGPDAGTSTDTQLGTLYLGSTNGLDIDWNPGTNDFFLTSNVVGADAGTSYVNAILQCQDSSGTGKYYMGASATGGEMLYSDGTGWQEISPPSFDSPLIIDSSDAISWGSLSCSPVQDALLYVNASGDWASLAPPSGTGNSNLYVLKATTGASGNLTSLAWDNTNYMCGPTQGTFVSLEMFSYTLAGITQVRFAGDLTAQVGNSTSLRSVSDANTFMATADNALTGIRPLKACVRAAHPIAAAATVHERFRRRSSIKIARASDGLKLFSDPNTVTEYLTTYSYENNGTTFVNSQRHTNLFLMPYTYGGRYIPAYYDGSSQNPSRGPSNRDAAYYADME